MQNMAVDALLGSSSWPSCRQSVMSQGSMNSASSAIAQQYGCGSFAILDNEGCRSKVARACCVRDPENDSSQGVCSSRNFTRLALAKTSRKPHCRSASGRSIIRASTQSGGDLPRESSAIVLRRLLNTPGVHQGPACYDALSAKLVELAGFNYAFMSGFAVSAVKLAAPDAGLISYGEMVDQARQITAAVSIPVIGDGDNGYGNALNVKRTVKGYHQAGLAGIILEDQVSPKACGHTNGRRVIPREEAIAKIRAAVDARIEANSDIVIVARTDARQAVSLDEALWRIKAFADAGADVLFIDALTSKDEMAAFARLVPGVPKMASMLEGGGKTPILPPFELDQLGFKLVAYPLSLVGVSIRAMQDALKAIKSGRLPPPGDLPKFEEIKEVVGFSRYYAEDDYYASIARDAAADTSPSAPPFQDKVPDFFPTQEPSTYAGYGTPSTSYPSFDRDNAKYDAGFRSGSEWASTATSQPVKPEVMGPEVLPAQQKGGLRDTLEKLWSRKLRVIVTGSSGSNKLDIKIPAGFLDGLAATVPGVAGLNLRAMLDEAAVKSKGKLESGQLLIDVTDRRGERFQVFLE